MRNINKRKREISSINGTHDLIFGLLDIKLHVRKTGTEKDVLVNQWNDELWSVVAS